MKIIAGAIRRLLADKTDTFTFHRCLERRFSFNPRKSFGLYFHIPFCRGLCPYCPYNKVDYEESLAKHYAKALRDEIRLSAELFGRQKFESLYVGGGTPSLMLSELEGILSDLHKHFNVTGPLAIETTPADITSEKIARMKALGVSYVSLGVQSFQSKYLSFLGRNDNAGMTQKAVDLMCQKHFQIVNLDLIFAYPEQTIEEMMMDLERAVSYQPEQITCYPLFTFPYSPVGRFLKLRKVRMPHWQIRRKMYYRIMDFFSEKGYRQSSVWSFNRNQDGKYSSVTRDYYLGFGAGAASYDGQNFYFNTFSVPEYIQTASKRTPVAIRMAVSRRLEKLFWLYWRCYDTEIPLKEYEHLFTKTVWDDWGLYLRMMRFAGFFHPQKESLITLNQRGAFWIHLLQNQFALNYVNILWTQCRQQSWPLEIRI